VSKKIGRPCRYPGKSFVAVNVGARELRLSISAVAFKPIELPEKSTMKVMIFVKATADSEAGVMPTPELLSAMGEFNQSLVNAGILLAAEGLKPSRDGKRVRFSGKSRTVIDGPFTETKELVAGFWLWQVRSIEEAVEWVKRCPNPMLTESDIEIRPVFALEDFGAAPAAELKT
jgi:hypothetical protein